MNGISTYASNSILNFLLGRSSLTVPSIFYLGLSSTPLGNDGIGFTEPTDPAYRKEAIANDKVSFSAAINKLVSLQKEYTFQPSTVDWDRLTHFIITDNNMGGNIWFYGELQNSLDVQVESSPILYANTNQFSFDICGGSTEDMAITTQAANKIIDHILGRSPALTPPEKFYLGVSSRALSTEGVGAIEPWGGGYQRLEIPNDKNSFTTASSKVITLAKEFRFASAQVPWGNMTHFFISDTPTGENVWWTGKLLHGRNTEISTVLVVKPNGFRWRLDTCNSPSTP